MTADRPANDPSTSPPTRASGPGGAPTIATPRPGAPTADSTTPEPPATGRPPIDERRQVADSAALVCFGTIYWLGPLWLLAALVNVVALWAVGRWGTLEASIWTGAFAGWQPWVVGAAGIAACHYFSPVLVASGASRRVVGWGMAVAGMAIALGGATIVTLGFAVEARWLRSRDVTAWIDNDHTATAATIGYPLVFVTALLLLLSTWFGGWALLATVQAFGDIGYLAIPLWLVPMAATSMLIDHRLSSGPLWLTRHFHLDNTPVGVTLAVVLVAAIGTSHSGIAR